MTSRQPHAGETPPFDPVARWAATDASRPAVVDAITGRVVTYAELHGEAEQWCGVLLNHGIRPGDRVAVLAHNRYEFLPLFIACLRTGAALVPLNWRLAPPELARVLDHAMPRLVFAEARFRAHRESAPACAWIDLDADLSARLTAIRSPHATHAVITADQLAMVLYTSGTTGAPKGVMISHAQLHWNALSTCEGWALSDADVAPITTPFFHTAAWHVFTTPLWWCGACVVVLGDFDASRLFAQLEQFGVTQLFCVPTQLQRLLDAPGFGRPLPALRGLVSGGAPLAPHLAQRFRAAGYPVRDAYGLTECGPNCFMLPPHALQRKPQHVGWPLPRIEMRVVGPDGEIVRANVIGELQLRAPQLTTGYYRDPEQTAAAFTADGWFRTGDLVRADDDGAYEICGRTKDIYISGGENVYPGEVEAALATCEGVREVAVVAVPDPTWGETGYAFIVPDNPTVEPAQVLREVRAKLAGYKVPKRAIAVAALPTLGSGKRDTEALRSLALRTALDEH